MSETAIVTCTVLEILAVNRGKLVGMASVEIEVEGVVFLLKGVQVFKYREHGGDRDMAGVGPPRFRAADGTWQDAIQLPPEVESVLRDAVMRRANEVGVTQCHQTLSSFSPSAKQGWHKR